MSNSGLITASHNAAKTSRGYDFEKTTLNLGKICKKFSESFNHDGKAWQQWQVDVCEAIFSLTVSQTVLRAHSFMAWSAAFVRMPRMLLRRFEPISKDSHLWMFFAQIWSRWLINWSQSGSVQVRAILDEPAPEHWGSVQPVVAPEPAPQCSGSGRCGSGAPRFM